MNQTVVYSSTLQLPCACETDAEVVLCITVGILTSGTTLEADLLRTYKEHDSCGRLIFKYVFQYDDASLLNPDNLLIATNIEGLFCKGCLTDWIEEQVVPTPTGDILLGARTLDLTDSANQGISISEDSYYITAVYITEFSAAPVFPCTGSLYADAVNTITLATGIDFSNSEVGVYLQDSVYVISDAQNNTLINDNWISSKRTETTLYLKMDDVSADPITCKISVYGRIL